jgi:protein DJ-1
MSRNIRIVPDAPSLISLPYQSAHEYFDILILPGGGPGSATFCKTPTVLELIDNFRKNGKWVAAICAGTTALVESVKTHGGPKARVTSHPSVKEKVEKEGGWEYSEEECVVDEGKKIITSRG